MISHLEDWYAEQISITANHFLNHSQDEKGIDNLLNWIWKNISYDEYLKYKKRIIESYNLKLYYFNLRPNFGDTLNEEILSSVFKLKFEFASFQNADLCCVGSILDKLITNSEISKEDKKMQNECEINKPLHIWGTGLMHIMIILNRLG